MSSVLTEILEHSKIALAYLVYHKKNPWIFQHKQFFALYFNFILVCSCHIRNHWSRVALEDTSGEVQLDN